MWKQDGKTTTTLGMAVTQQQKEVCMFFVYFQMNDAGLNSSLESRTCHGLVVPALQATLGILKSESKMREQNQKLASSMNGCRKFTFKCNLEFPLKTLPERMPMKC